MAMSVTYTTFNGQIVYENRAGVESYYAPDTLGSTAALLNASGVVTDTFTYQPYGEIASHVGSSLTPFTYCGTLGYYTDTANSSIYVRARYYRPNLARWQTVDPLWPGEVPYSYALNNPVMYSDPTGNSPDCQTMANCLRSHTNRCGSVGKGKDPSAPVSLALCLFWQETSLGQQSPPGGVGSCTPACFNELKRRGCSWLSKFPSYSSFVNNASACEKAQAAYDFLATVGLSSYGPGPGKPGDYRGPTGDRVKSCSKCMDGGASHECYNNFGPSFHPSFNSICSYCFGKVHS